MAVYLSAGVYVKETDLSQIVPTTSTSIGAIVGEFSRGPIDEPVLIQNTKQFIDVFGKPDPVNLTWPSAYCALAFLEKSSQLFVQRAMPTSGYAYGGTIVTNVAGFTANTGNGQLTPKVPSPALSSAQAFYAYAIGPGTYSNNNLGILIESESVYTPPIIPDTTNITAVVSATGGTFAAAGTYGYRVSVVTQDGETDASVNIPAVLANTTDKVLITIPHIDGAISYKIYRTNVSPVTAHLLRATVVATGSTVTFSDTGAVSAGALPVGTTSTQSYATGAAALTGVWSGAGTKYYRFSVISDAGETLPSTAITATVAAVTDNVTVTIPLQENASSYRVYRGDSAGTERLLTSIAQPSSGTFVSYVDIGSAIASTEPLASAVTSTGKTPEFTVKVFNYEVSTSVEVESFTVSLEDRLDGFGVQMQIEDKINTFSRYIRVTKNAAYTGPEYFYSSSTIGLFTGGLLGTAPTSSDISLAWDNFADKEKITVRLLINGGVTSVTVQQKMNTIAANRGDCVAILDMPTQYQSETGQSEVNYRRSVLNLNSNRSAIYTPDLYINDPYNDKLLYVPPSGHVAAVYANTDYVAQAWFAPAGLNRGLLTIQGLRFKYNQAARDLLAPAQVNYMRNFPGQGIAVWEALTMQAKTSALSYINVRRLLDIIEISVSEALLYSVYEPNDDFLRRQIVGMITEFLEVIRNRRGLQEYAVISDDSNNPPSVTGVGQLNVDVYLIPTLPAQKIQLQTVITKQGASFSELIATGGQF